MKITINFRRAMRDSVRMYFAPLTGAVHGVRTELRRNAREIQIREKTEGKRKIAKHA
jgi:hypothetical protein